jgi:type VI secretion system protein ImpA
VVVVDRAMLLNPTDEVPPCGPNLEHDLAFFTLEEAAKGKPEQRLGDVVRPAEDPNWSVVAETAHTLLLKSKDLRVAVHLTRALIHTEGLSGLAAGLELIHGLLERYWDAVYPRLEADHADDPTERVNGLAPLTDPGAVIADIRSARFVESREHGQLQIREVEIALGRLAPVGAGTVKTLGEVHAQIAAAFGDDRTLVRSVRRSRELVETIQGLVNERVGAEHAVDLKPLRQCLDSVLEVCDAVLTDERADGVAAPPLPAADRSTATAFAAPLAEVRSRDDAVRLLDHVCAYLRVHEPSNPAPLFIRRAQRLMRKDFVAIVKDLIPDSLPSLERLAGGLDET